MEGPGRQPLTPLDDEIFVGHVDREALRASCNSRSSRDENSSIGKALGFFAFLQGRMRWVGIGDVWR